MLLREVEYAKPSSVADALAILAEHDGAKRKDEQGRTRE